MGAGSPDAAGLSMKQRGCDRRLLQKHVATQRRQTSLVKQLLHPIRSRGVVGKDLENRGCVG